MTIEKVYLFLVVILVAIILNGCAALEIGSLICSAIQEQGCQISMQGQESK